MQTRLAEKRADWAEGFFGARRTEESHRVNQGEKTGAPAGANPVLEKVQELYDSLLAHDGFGELRIEMRILKFGQKEVIIHCGKQYRYVVDFPGSATKGKQPQTRG